MLEFSEPGKSYAALPLVPERWSTHPEPLRWVLVLDDEGKPQFILQYDPTIVPQTLRLDLAVSGHGEEVAIAVQRADGTASAFGAESYAFPDWQKPEWELRHQIYDVTVRVSASGLETTRRFRLNNLALDFATFGTLNRA